MKLWMQFRRVIGKGNAGLGWSALWRMALILVPLNLLSQLAATEAASNPAAGVAMLFALPIGGNMYLVPFAIPVVLFAWNWVGKAVLRKRLEVTTPRFIGWALYWRVALLQLAGILVLSLLFVPLTLLARAAGDRAQMVILAIAGLVLLPALVYWTLNVAGFVLRRVAAMVAAGAEEPGAGGVGALGIVRDHAAIFDRDRFGVNWMLAAAYVATGLTASVTWPAVQALFGGGFEYYMKDSLHVYLIAWILAGAVLTLAVHYLRAAWQVVLAFTLWMVAQRLLEGLLHQAFGTGFPMPVADLSGLVLRASFALLFVAGMLAGIRFWGPTIRGFALGTGAGQLIHSLLLIPLVLLALGESQSGGFLDWTRFASDTLAIAVDAAITGAIFWWVCDWHVRRCGFRLTHRGLLESLTGAPAAEPGAS